LRALSARSGSKAIGVALKLTEFAGVTSPCRLAKLVDRDLKHLAGIVRSGVGTVWTRLSATGGFLRIAPAWQRHSGSLYQASRDAIATALDAGVHMIIVSGGYGLVLAAEPIGYYEAVFKNSWWPDRLLDEVLIEYLRRHKLRALRAVASATTGYARLLRRVNWRLAGVESAMLLTPEETTGAMVKSPRAQGEALSGLLRGEIDTDWTSSDGLHLACTSLI
jgi:hypothetical protein